MASTREGKRMPLGCKRSREETASERWVRGERMGLTMQRSVGLKRLKFGVRNDGGIGIEEKDHVNVNVKYVEYVTVS